MIKNFAIESMNALVDAVANGEAAIVSFEMYEYPDEGETTLQVRFRDPNRPSLDTNPVEAIAQMFAAHFSHIQNVPCGEENEGSNPAPGDETSEGETVYAGPFGT